MVLRQNSGTAPFHNCKPFSFKGFQLLRFDLHGNVKRNIRKEQPSRSFYSYYSIESHEMNGGRRTSQYHFRAGDKTDCEHYPLAVAGKGRQILRAALSRRSSVSQSRVRVLVSIFSVSVLLHRMMYNALFFIRQKQHQKFVIMPSFQSFQQLNLQLRSQ